MKLHMHNHIMVIYIHYEFHELLSLGYLVMTEDRKSDGQTERWTNRRDNAKPISLHLWGGVTNILVTVTVAKQYSA